jgi:hypothetical protein
MGVGFEFFSFPRADYLLCGDLLSSPTVSVAHFTPFSRALVERTHHLPKRQFARFIIDFAYSG